MTTTSRAPNVLCVGQHGGTPRDRSLVSPTGIALRRSMRQWKWLFVMHIYTATDFSNSIKVEQRHHGETTNLAQQARSTGTVPRLLFHSDDPGDGAVGMLTRLWGRRCGGGGGGSISNRCQTRFLPPKRPNRLCSPPSLSLLSGRRDYFPGS